VIGPAPAVLLPVMCIDFFPAPELDVTPMLTIR